MEEFDITRLDLMRRLIEMDPEFADRAMQLAQGDPSGLGLESMGGMGAGQLPQQQIAPASIPTPPPDTLDTLTQNMNPKVIQQIVQQLQKDTLNDKPIGPDVIAGITGQTGQGGFFGLGIQPTDVLGFALGALLSRKMPTDKAIQTTMQMATLPAQFRQQQRENIQKLLTQIVGVAGQERLANQLKPVAGGYVDPRSRQFTRTQPAARHELAIGTARTPEDLMVALGLRQAPGLPGEAGRVESERERAREPGRVAASERATAATGQRIRMQEESRKRIIGVMAAVTRSNPTSLEKNIGMVEKRTGRKLTNEELMELLKRSSGNPLDTVLAEMLSGRGGGAGGGGRNLSPEAEGLLDR